MLSCKQSQCPNSDIKRHFLTAAHKEHDRLMECFVCAL